MPAEPYRRQVEPYGFTLDLVMCEAIVVSLHALVDVWESGERGPCVSSACEGDQGFALDGRQLTQHWSSRSGHERKLVPVVAVAD